MCQPTDFYKRGQSSTLSMSTQSSTRSTDYDDEFFSLVMLDTFITSSNTSTTEPKLSKKKRVRFGTVAIVQLEVRIGDSVPSYGPPIGLGQEVVQTDVWCVNHYESVRPARKSLKELKMDPWKRTRLLYRQGYEPAAIEQAASEADTIRSNRKESTFDEDKPVQERPGLIQKGSKKLRRLSNRLRLPVLPLVSRCNLLTTTRRKF